MEKKKLTEQEIMEQSMQMNLESDLEHESLCSRYAGMDVDEICEVDALDEDENGDEIIDEFEDVYDENEEYLYPQDEYDDDEEDDDEDDEDIDEEEDDDEEEEEDPHSTSYLDDTEDTDFKYYTFFRRYSDWPTQLEEYVENFKIRFGVYPNCCIMARNTYSRMEDAFNLVLSRDLSEREKHEYGQQLGIYRNGYLDEYNMYQDLEYAAYFSKENYRLVLLEDMQFGSGVIELRRVHGSLADDPQYHDICKVSNKDKTAIPFPVIDMEKTGQNIKKIMDEEGVSQVLLTRIFNISKQAVNGWVNGKSLPSVDNLTVLSRILNRPLDTILITRERGK